MPVIAIFSLFGKGHAACARLLQCKKLAANELSQCKGTRKCRKSSLYPGEQPKKVKAPPRPNHTSSDNQDEMVKWLARVPYKLMGSRVTGSSPVASHFRLGQGKSKSCGFSFLPRRHNPDGFRGWRFRFGISTISFDVSFPLRDPRLY